MLSWSGLGGMGSPQDVSVALPVSSKLDTAQMVIM